MRCVDISQAACDLAAANARLNGLEDVMGFTCANVFEYLDALIADKRRRTEEGGPFDLIVLDPPAFTKSRKNVSAAARGYREINNQALRLLPRGGYLATCSCSHFMDADRLKDAVAQAAHDANVQLRQVEERQQAPTTPSSGASRDPLPGLPDLPGGVGLRARLCLQLSVPGHPST